MMNQIDWHGVRHCLYETGIVLLVIFGMLLIAAAGIFTLYLLAEQYRATIAHDVYACQLVAVPVPALPAATNT